MRFLGIGDYCDLSALYLRLVAEGHEVRVFISEPQCHGTLAGMVPRTDDWEAELPWLREAGEDGIILFENVSYARGSRQDSLRAEGFNVIGGSAYGDRLENDRAYAQRVLGDLGLQVAPVWEFDTQAEAEAFLDGRPGRYVLKFNGDGFGAADTYVGRLADARDVRAMVAAKFRQMGRSHIGFVLMEHVEGVEMGVGAYFDGDRFLTPACLDWEHKHFFPGDLGELTGEMGTVVTYDRSTTFFDLTLARMAPLLRQHGYCGYINLNTIVNERGIWPLEFTCRFGYPGYAILDPLQTTSWSALFKAMVTRSGLRFETAPGFAVGIVVTTRPFPFIRTYVPEPIGLPVLFDGPLTTDDRDNLHFGEMGLDGDQLVTAGYHGWTLVVTGTGDTLPEAQLAAYRLTRRVVIPNLRYRNDIGDRLIARQFAEVERLGFLDAPDPEALS
ncbi:MAG: phosphoribosylamine--glycine ligase [Janthinobacterium lividum]